mmetsp:Transcript_61886/g.73338  ORF Transcript_61886/g.73338 Transcript_61886/m.73338 type:complete len:89 (+) Transcript_61886:491-757(+)
MENIQDNSGTGSGAFGGYKAKDKISNDLRVARGALSGYEIECKISNNSSIRSGSRPNIGVKKEEIRVRSDAWCTVNFFLFNKGFFEIR